MDSLDRDAVLTLARHVGWPAVSIYMPTRPGHAESAQEQLRLKNLLRQAMGELAERGMKRNDADALLSCGNEMLDDGAIWRSTDEGIALFCSESSSSAFMTPIVMPERVRVAEMFSVRPLLPVLDMNVRYFLLALSQKKVRIFEGERGQLTELDAPGIPGSLAEVLRRDDYEDNVQFHTRTPAAAAGKGRRAASFHGHGGISDVAREHIERYFRMVDSGIADLLQGEDAPLIIAGVEYLVPIYREVSSYAHLAENTIAGNPDELTPHELAAGATRLLGDLQDRALERDLALLEETAGTTASSNEIEDIVNAAHEGRVRVLFVSPDRSQWGTFDPSTNITRAHETPQTGDQDLTDLAVAETLLHGGTVHVTERETAASAIFRY